MRKIKSIEIFTVIGIIIAIFAWLAPFENIGESPLNNLFRKIFYQENKSEINSQQIKDNSKEDVEQTELTLLPEDVFDCWLTIWELTPMAHVDIETKINFPLSNYYQFEYDEKEAPSGSEGGSLKVTTSKHVKNLLSDKNTWSWIKNIDSIYAKNAKYRIKAWIKTQNSVESHISIVAQDTFLQDIYMNGTNQISRIPISPRNGSYEWKEYVSLEFNPKSWSEESEIIFIGINAGPSFEDGEAITWFSNIELQICE